MVRHGLESVDDFLDQTASLVRSLSHRIWNDRESDHGLLQLMIGVWMSLWPTLIPGWEGLFYLLPSPLWGVLHVILGTLRCSLASRREKHLSSHVALASCALFSLQGLLYLFVQYRSLLALVFLWMGYQSLKSYLRLAVTVRRIRG